MLKFKDDWDDFLWKGKVFAGCDIRQLLHGLVHVVPVEVPEIYLDMDKRDRENYESNYNLNKAIMLRFCYFGQKTRICNQKEK